VGGGREIVSAQTKNKKEQNELAISSRTHSVTHLAGPPTVQVPPSYVPIQQKKANPRPSEEGMSSKPRFQVEGREREAREAEAGVVVGERERKPTRRHTW